MGLHSVGSAKDVSEKLHTFFFDELCRKQMENNFRVVQQLNLH